MDTKELRNKTQKELADILTESRKKLAQLTFDKTVGKLNKSHEYGETKKIIAKVLTLMQEK